MKDWSNSNHLHQKSYLKFIHVSALSNNDYFRILKALIIYIFFFCMNYVSNQNWKVLKEMLAGSRFCKNNIEMLFQNEPASFFCKFFKILSHPLSLVTCNREYYKWLCRLRPHIQIGRLPDQGTWLGLVTQFAIWGSMGPTGQTSNNSRINIRW